MRGQLKRQAAAHAEYLGEELGRQEQELAAHWQLKLFDELNKEKDRQFKEIATIRGKLLGLQVRRCQCWLLAVVRYTCYSYC